MSMQKILKALLMRSSIFGNFIFIPSILTKPIHIKFQSPERSNTNIGELHQLDWMGRTKGVPVY